MRQLIAFVLVIALTGCATMIDRIAAYDAAAREESDQRYLDQYNAWRSLPTYLQVLPQYMPNRWRFPE